MSTIEDEKISDIMYDSIKYRRPFRRFKDNIQKYNIEDICHKFREESLKEIAVSWCERSNIDYER